MVEAPDPVPGHGELRIAVHAAGVNFADILIRLGLYPDGPPPPCVVGYEVAGIIEEAGPAVTRYRKGDRVLAFTWCTTAEGSTSRKGPSRKASPDPGPYMRS